MIRLQHAIDDWDFYEDEILWEGLDYTIRAFCNNGVWTVSVSWQTENGVDDYDTEYVEAVNTDILQPMQLADKMVRRLIRDGYLQA